MHREIVEHQLKLQRLYEQAKHLQRQDGIEDETKSGFVSYLCVRTFGYVESSVKTILREYVKSNSNDRPTFNYVNSQLRNLTPRRDQILELLGQFNQNWNANLRDSITVDHGDSLRGIVVNRNDIAHGDDVDLSLLDLERYFVHAQEVVQLIFDECNH